MPTFVDVVKFEGEVPPKTIRLVKSGEFYRAYNHSAWLFQCCIAEHKIMRKYVKQLKQDIFYIGFPEKSLIGNIGDRKYTKTEMGYDIELHDEELPAAEGYETWKATLRRMKRKADNLDRVNCTSLRASVNSYLGVLSHYRSYCLRKKRIVYDKKLSAYGQFDPLILHFKSYAR